MATEFIVLNKIGRGIGSTSTILRILDNLKDSFPTLTILLISKAKLLYSTVDFVRKYKQTVFAKSIDSNIDGLRVDVAVFLDFPDELTEKQRYFFDQVRYQVKYVMIERTEREELIHVEMYGQ